MNTPSYTILFVENPLASADLYSSLFGVKPAHASENFVMFVLPHGYKFALWAAGDPDAHFAADGKESVAEIGIVLDSDAAVDRTFGEWSRKKGLTVAMAPKTLPFGRSFVFTDTDGHRIRGMAMAANPQ